MLKKGRPRWCRCIIGYRRLLGDLKVSPGLVLRRVLVMPGRRPRDSDAPATLLVVVYALLGERVDLDLNSESLQAFRVLEPAVAVLLSLHSRISQTSQPVLVGLLGFWKLQAGKAEGPHHRHLGTGPPESWHLPKEEHAQPGIRTRTFHGHCNG